jgi:hypothetical protein
MIRSTDSFGAFTEGPVWSFTTEKDLPVIEIGAITGSKGVSAVIQNNGNAKANNVTWEIYVTGGIFKLIYKSYVVYSISKKVTKRHFKNIHRIRKIEITVSASCEEVPIPIEKKVSGSIIFFG